MFEERTIHRFEIWYARLGGPSGTHIQTGLRPVIIVSNETANQKSPVISIIPLTSKTAKGNNMPTHAVVRSKHLRGPSVALCEQITTIDKTCLVDCVGSISGKDCQKAIELCIMRQLGIAPIHKNREAS